MKEFDLEDQYQQYLKCVQLDESTMAPLQKKQLKLTFMAACGQMLMLMKDLSNIEDEDQAVATLEDMINQVSVFMKKL